MGFMMVHHWIKSKGVHQIATRYICILLKFTFVFKSLVIIILNCIYENEFDRIKIIKLPAHNKQIIKKKKTY